MHLKKAIGQNIFWRGSYLASSFAINVLVSRLLSADRTGGVFYIVNNLAFIILITSLSLESGAAYYLAKKQVTPYKIAIFSILYSIAAAVASIFLFRFFFQNLVENDKTILLFFYVWGVLLVTFFTGLFSAMQNFRLPNIVLLTTNVLFILALFTFGNQPFVTRQFYYFYFSVFALQGFVLAIAFLIYYSNTNRKPTQQNNHVLRSIFRYSMLAISANIAYFLLYRVDYWFVNKFCTMADLGNYIQASKLGQLFLSIPSIVGASVFASIAAQTKGNAHKNVLAVSQTVFVIAALIMLVLISVGKWLFPFLFGSSFYNMFWPFVLLAPGTLAICFLYPLTAYFSGIKKIKVNLIGSLLALILVVIADLIFIPKFGIMAAAAISSIGYIIYALYVTIFFCHQNNIPFTSIFEIKSTGFNRLLNISNENIEQ